MALITIEDVEKERSGKTKKMIAAALVDFADFLPDIKGKREFLTQFALTHGLDIENIKYREWSHGLEKEGRSKQDREEEPSG